MLAGALPRPLEAARAIGVVPALCCPDGLCGYGYGKKLVRKVLRQVAGLYMRPEIAYATAPDVTATNIRSLMVQRRLGAGPVASGNPWVFSSDIEIDVKELTSASHAMENPTAAGSPVEVNVATAIHRLARLTGDRREASAQIFQGKQWALVMQRLTDLIPSSGSQVLANGA
eukprot:Skav232469  [mRNA]  locus=scaffold2877:95185:101307:+ [translate_table: standard]